MMMMSQLLGTGKTLKFATPMSLREDTGYIIQHFPFILKVIQCRLIVYLKQW